MLRWTPIASWKYIAILKIMKIYISLWNIYLVETWWHFFVLKFICFYLNMHLTFWTGSSNYIIKIICHIWNMVNIEQKMVLHAHLLMFQYPVKVLFAFTVYIFCCLLLIYFQIILTFGVIYLIYGEHQESIGLISTTNFLIRAFSTFPICNSI